MPSNIQSNVNLDLKYMKKLLLAILTLGLWFRSGTSKKQRFETLAIHGGQEPAPVTLSVTSSRPHRQFSEEQQSAGRLPPELRRLCIGIDPLGGIWADIENSLQKA